MIKNNNDKDIITYNNVKVTNIIHKANKFIIFKGTMNGKDKITFKGYLDTQIGEKLIIHGKITQNETYGEQIFVQSYEKITDIDFCDLEDFFKGFNGIGPKKAKKIVDTFGENSIEQIKKNYLCLIPLGIKESIAKEIQFSLCKNEVLNILFKKLSQFNISLNTINKIYNKYGESSLDILKYNPYLFKEEFNIPFEFLDRFSLKEGLPSNHIPRIMSAIRESLYIAANYGHTFAFVSEIIKKSKKILNKTTDTVSSADILKVLVYMNKEKEIILKEDKTVFLPHFYYAERNIARKILLLNKPIYKTHIDDFDGLINEVENEVKIHYSDNQKKGIKVGIEEPIVIITGGPGTGKTTTLNGLIHGIKHNNPDVKLCLVAPTGKAAKRMEESTGLKATTVHRILECKPYGDELDYARNEENPLDADVVIADESSMFDVLLFEKLLRAIKEGTKLVIVGDVDQLPSVGPGKVLQDLIDCRVLPVVRLETIFRQTGTSTIILNAKNINSGLGLILTNPDFMLVEVDDTLGDKEVSNLLIKEFLKRKNDGMTLDDMQILSPMKKRDNLVGTIVLNQEVQKLLNPKRDGIKEVTYAGTTYREGDRVIQTHNNHKKDCFNGDVGVITSIVKNKEVELTVKFDDKDVVFVGREEITELELAYALTIHKSQGSEYKLVLIPVVESQKILLTRSVLYTGVTRAKQTVILFGSKKAINYAINNTKTARRYSRLARFISETLINFN